MKNNIFKKVLVMGAIAMVPTVVSAQSANVAITGEDSVYQNDMITLNVKVNNVNDVKDGLVAVGGDIMYDPSYLTLVDTIAVSNPYKFDGNLIKEGNYRIAGVDFTMENGIKNDTVVYSIVFKSLKTGNTTVSFENPDLVNTNAENVEGTTTSKVLEILEKEVVVEETNNENEVEVNNNKTTTPVVLKEETNNIVEEVITKENKEVKNVTKTNETKKDETKVEETVKEETQESKEDKKESENKGIFTSIITGIADTFRKILELLFK